MPLFQHIKFIITDIEGTTTDIAFVHQILFPYSRERIADFVAKNSDNTNVQTCLNEVRDSISEEEKKGKKEISRADCVAALLHYIDIDRKHGALKTLQGLIWREGYENGSLRAHVYDDVPPVLQQWKTAGKTLGVYSSGSVAAQKLLFKYASIGDLTPLFSFYFDTKIGHKRDSIAYENIIKTSQFLPAETLFLSDIEAELDAAQMAGLQTLQLVRPGTVASALHATANNFNEIILG